MKIVVCVCVCARYVCVCMYGTRNGKTKSKRNAVYCQNYTLYPMNSNAMGIWFIVSFLNYLNFFLNFLYVLEFSSKKYKGEAYKHINP